MEYEQTFRFILILGFALIVPIGAYHRIKSQATAWAVVANSLVTANWFLALTGGIVFGLMVLRTRIEEEKLIERFGEEYKEYLTLPPLK